MFSPAEDMRGRIEADTSSSTLDEEFPPDLLEKTRGDKERQRHTLVLMLKNCRGHGRKILNNNTTDHENIQFVVVTVFCCITNCHRQEEATNPLMSALHGNKSKDFHMKIQFVIIKLFLFGIFDVQNIFRNLCIYERAEQHAVKRADHTAEVKDTHEIFIWMM